jgi:hypothetical protein
VTWLGTRTRYVTVHCITGRYVAIYTVTLSSTCTLGEEGEGLKKKSIGDHFGVGGKYRVMHTLIYKLLFDKFYRLMHNWVEKLTFTYSIK